MAKATAKPKLVRIPCPDAVVCDFVLVAAAQLQAAYGDYVPPVVKKNVVIIDARSFAALSSQLEQFNNADYWDEIVYREHNPMDISYEDFKGAMAAAFEAIAVVSSKLLREYVRAVLAEGIRVYHGTYQDFKKFKDTGSHDFGFHFGTLEQAKTRLENIPKEMEARGATSMRGFHKKMPIPEEHGQIMEVELDINNPLRLGELTSKVARPGSGSWDHWKIINDIFDDPPDWVTDKEIRKYEDGTLFDMAYDPDTIKWLIKWLNKKGFDGIVYANEFEGGGDSYIAFKPKQIRIVRRIPYSEAAAA